MAKPRATYIMPRVAIKGATLNLVITRPFNVPITTPNSMVMMNTAGTLKYRVTPNI